MLGEKLRADHAHFALSGLGLRGLVRVSRGGRVGSRCCLWRARTRARFDRLALRIGLRLREELGALLVYNDIPGLDGGIIELLERICPGLARGAATAGGIYCLAIGEGGRQFGIITAGT